MERTITILGTIDNCKKAESLISAKLRASYESDMTQFMNYTGPSVSHHYSAIFVVIIIIIIGQFSNS